MSYISWRPGNEDHYIQYYGDTDRVLPAFQVSAFSPLSGTVIKSIAEQISNKPGMNLISFPAVFAEYLHEEYGVIPADIEILCQTIYMMTFKQIDVTAQTTAQMIIASMGTSSDEESEDDRD